MGGSFLQGTKAWNEGNAWRKPVSIAWSITFDEAWPVAWQPSAHPKWYFRAQGAHKELNGYILITFMSLPPRIYSFMCPKKKRSTIDRDVRSIRNEDMILDLLPQKKIPSPERNEFEFEENANWRGLSKSDRAGHTATRLVAGPVRWCIVVL